MIFKMLKTICLRQNGNRILRTLVIMTSTIICTCHRVRGTPYTSIVSDAARTETCWWNSLEPAASFDKHEMCDSSTNCRYGGICWSSRSDVSVPQGHRRSHRGTSPHVVCRCTMHCQSLSGGVGTHPDSLVCGSDGRTYNNECQLRLAACRCQFPITVFKVGACERGSSPHMTPSARPHDLSTDAGSGSGSDVIDICSGGVTCRFGAVCDVDAEEGPCLCTTVCDMPAYTVCGTDGRSYYNECYLRDATCQEQREIEVEHVGRCQTTEGSHPVGEPETGSGYDSEISICNALNCAGEVLNPLCGSDGINYPTLCSMRVASCKQQKVITMRNTGYCIEPGTEEIVTKPENDKHDEVAKKKPHDPCENIYCLQGVCVPIGTDDFECSCEHLCSKEAVSSQTSIAHISGISLRQLYNMMPDIKDQLFVEDTRQIQTETTTTTTPTTTTSIPADEPEILDEPIIMSLDGVKELKELRVKPGRSQGLYRTASFDIIGTPRGNKRRRRHRTDRQRNRERRRFRRSVIFDETSSYVNETVCGTDGKTYSDECQMRVTACYAKKIVKIRKIGACPYIVKKMKHKQKSETKLNAPTTSRPTVTTTTVHTTTTTPTSTSTLADTTSNSTLSAIISTSKLDREATDATPQQQRPRHTVPSNISTNGSFEQVSATAPSDSNESVEELPEGGVEENLESRDKWQKEFKEEPQVSEAHILEYSWLIAIAAILYIATVALVVGLCCKHYRIKQQNKKNQEDNPEAESLNNTETSGGLE
nr:agrin-like [Ciona intestinalis]|eukprot:XP_018668138.1 agrin-like [Ciona intestinalis]